MIKNNIVLFDMDGTLTEPRDKFNTELLLDLRKLSNYAEIGILSGADFPDIEKQLLKLIKFSEVRFKMHLLPCNGTKHYKPPEYSYDEYVACHQNDMKKELGESCFKEVFKIVTHTQADACYYSIPLTGHFVNYRGSMINFCPIGRNASKLERAEFIKYDSENNFRNMLIKKIDNKLTTACPNKVVVKAGGQTSIDIYPTGWDKTYALKHFEGKTCWFVGDACHEGGNDYEIYEFLKKEERAFHTKSPFHTGEIIRNEILPKLMHP